MKSEDNKDFICIGKSNPLKRPNAIQIRTKSDWFVIGSYVKVNIHEDCIIFSKPNLDYNGDMYKVSKQADYWKKITVTTTDNLPISEYIYFDKEESNEDEIVVYFI